MAKTKYIDCTELIESLLVDPVECPGCPEPESLPDLIAILADAPAADVIATPDKEKISNALYHIYRNISTHTPTEGVVAMKYYIAETYKAATGEDGPPWLI